VVEGPLHRAFTPSVSLLAGLSWIELLTCRHRVPGFRSLDTESEMNCGIAYGDSSSVRVAARSGETSDAALLFVWPDGRPRGVYSSRDDDENLAASSSGPRPRASREIRIRSRWRALEGDLRSGEETFLGRLPSSRRRPHPFVGLAVRPTANHFMIEPGWRRPPLTPRLQPARSYQRVSVGAQTTPRHQPMNKAHGSWQ